MVVESLPRETRRYCGILFSTSSTRTKCVPRWIIVHLMYGPEGNSQFCFPESPDVSRDEVEGNISTLGKTKLFPSGPYIKCFVIYLDFHIPKTNKQRLRAGKNCAIVSQSGYI